MASTLDRSTATLGDLWRQFLPLSVSDVTMMMTDPLVTTTLAHLPAARANLAAVGIARSLAVFLESPIIMLLHASNALAGAQSSRRAVGRFTGVAVVVLTLAMATLATDTVFAFVAGRVLGVAPELVSIARGVVGMLILWPASIAWRRYVQGLLIHSGHGGAVARAGVARIVVVAAVLVVGFSRGAPGAWLAAMALIAGLIAEALVVTVAARSLGVFHAAAPESRAELPSTLAGVWRFYAPLAVSMVVVWGARAALVGIVARATDGPVALAAWPAAWGLVLLVANWTRMVQQVVIRNSGRTRAGGLLAFGASVGLVGSLLLMTVGATGAGSGFVQAFIGRDPELASRVVPVLLGCTLVPLMVALQNAAQGLLIAAADTRRVNRSTILGTLTMLGMAAGATAAGAPGALAAATGMVGGLAVELGCLARGVHLMPHAVADESTRG